MSDPHLRTPLPIFAGDRQLQEMLEENQLEQVRVTAEAC